MKIPTALSMLLTLAAQVCTAQAQEIGDIRKGRVYAERVCADCHAVLPWQAVSPDVNATTFNSIANAPGMTATALAVWFRTPHPTMPNLVIEGEDMDNVIAYILSLRERK